MRQLAVELDTYKNEYEGNGNHIGIVTTSVEYSVVSWSLSEIAIDLKSGKDITVKIYYNGWIKMLQVSVAYSGEPLIKFLNEKIIMQDTVPQNTYIGFSAYTAFFLETHQILNWNFTLLELPQESLDYGIDRHREKRNKILLSVFMPLTFLFISLGLGLFLMIRMRRKKRIQREEDIEMLTRNAANAPKFFTFRHLAKATKNFSRDNLLGSGGFGNVYRGVFSDHPPATVAVKRINATSHQGS